MGLKSAVKKVVKGVKKVFKKVVKAVGKFLNSKLGKAIMLAATVVTGGMALYGAYMGAGAGASFAASQGGGFMAQFAGGAKGMLAGAMKGMGAASKMMGNALTGNFAGAKAAFTGLGSAATEAGRVAAGGMADMAQNTVKSPLEDIASKAAQEGGGAGNSLTDAQQMVTSGGTPAGGAPAGGGSPGLNLNATGGAPEAGSYTDQFKGMLQEGMKDYVAPQTNANPGFLQTLKNSIASPEGLLAAGKMVSKGAELWAGAESEKDKLEEEKRAIRRGWTNDPRANVQLFNNGPGYA